MGDGASSRVDGFTEWALAFIGAALFIILDPLGLSDGADRLSERIALGVAAPLLSHVEPGRQRDARTHLPDAPGGPRPGSAITVLLVDEAFMAALPAAPDGTRPRWPLPRERQMELLFAPLLDMGPRALFVDWVIHQPGPGDDAGRLRLALERFMEERGWDDGSGPLLLFADRPAAADGAIRRGQALRWTDGATLVRSSQTASTLAPLFDTSFARRVATRWYGRPDRYPLAPLALAPPGALPDRPPFAAGDTALASPALALFALWCSGSAQARANAACREIGTSLPPPAGYIAARAGEAAAMSFSTLSAPQWLALQEPGMRRLRANASPDHPCLDRESTRGVWGGLLDSLRLRRAASEEEVPYNPCFAVTTLSARDLGTTNASGLSGPALARLVEGRLVLLGVDLDSAPDRTDSPVNGIAPAVLLHATVLENLLNSGPDRSRDPPALPLVGAQTGLVLALLLAAVAALPATSLCQQRIAAMEANGRQRPPRQGQGLLCLLAALLSAPLAGLLLGPLAMALAALCLCLAVRAMPERLGGTALLAALAGGLLLPLMVALGLYFWTNWAPANWISGLTAKLFMLGGSLAALTGFVRRRRPAIFVRLGNWQGWPLLASGLRTAPGRWGIGAGLFGLLLLLALLVKQEELPAWLGPALLVALGLAAVTLAWLVAGWSGLLLIAAMAFLLWSAMRTGWYPDEGLLLVFGWMATLALFPLALLVVPARVDKK